MQGGTQGRRGTLGRKSVQALPTGQLCDRAVLIQKAALDTQKCDLYGPAEVFRAVATQRVSRDLSHGMSQTTTLLLLLTNLQLTTYYFTTRVRSFGSGDLC